MRQYRDIDPWALVLAMRDEIISAHRRAQRARREGDLSSYRANVAEARRLLDMVRQARRPVRWA